MLYATDADLLILRPDILSYGPTEWADMHAKAAEIITRDLDVNWYRGSATERGVAWKAYPLPPLNQRTFDYAVYPFDAELLLNAESQLKSLGCFKALELIFASLTKGTDDTFASLRDHYAASYKAELPAVCAAGIDYDWNQNGAIDDTDKAQAAAPRRLVRC